MTTPKQRLVTALARERWNHPAGRPYRMGERAGYAREYKNGGHYVCYTCVTRDRRTVFSVDVSLRINVRLVQWLSKSVIIPICPKCDGPYVMDQPLWDLSGKQLLKLFDPEPYYDRHDRAAVMQLLRIMPLGAMP